MSVLGSHTFDTAELLWLAIACVGLGLAYDGLRSACSDLELVKSRANVSSPRELELELGIARADVAGARWVVAFELICVLVGVLAATMAAPPAGRTTQGWVILTLLIVAAAAVPARTYGQRRRRHRLLRNRRVDD